MNLIREIWKTYPCNDNYEVSNMGRVKRAKDSGRGHKRGALLNAYKINSGYFSVTLWKNGIWKHKTVHSMVLETFTHLRVGKMQIDHINDIKKDNRLVNLRWLTRLENAHHLSGGEGNGNAKLSHKDVLYIKKMLYDGCYTQKEIARRFNVSRSIIGLIAQGRRWNGEYLSY